MRQGDEETEGAPDFLTQAVTSLQVMAARAGGLHLDHKALLRRYQPATPQAPNHLNQEAA